MVQLPATAAIEYVTMETILVMVTDNNTSV